MTYGSKKTITNIVTNILLLAGYFLYTLGEGAPKAQDVKGWATLILIFIGIGIVASIVIQILFHIAFSIGVAVKERDRDDKLVERSIQAAVVEDEMDKTISLKAMRVEYACGGAGSVLAIAALALGAAVVTALHILFVSAAAATIVGGCVSIYFYERGVRNA